MCQVDFGCSGECLRLFLMVIVNVSGHFRLSWRMFNDIVDCHGECFMLLLIVVVNVSGCC